jgi:hypothetical protein
MIWSDSVARRGEYMDVREIPKGRNTAMEGFGTTPNKCFLF